MQKASDDFENLPIRYWAIAIGISSLCSIGTTSTLIDRQSDRVRWALTLTKILTSLSSALRPLPSLVRLYLSSSIKECAIVKSWLTHSEFTYDAITISDIRRKLPMLVEILNVSLSCLTHVELARARDVSETEEWRVLSEVTKNVFHNWYLDVAMDVATGIRRQADRVSRSVEPPGYVIEDAPRYVTLLLNDAPPDLGRYPPSRGQPKEEA
ncbi:hypothetical protein RBB50_012472 [Rhinocladiella similis]